MLTVTSKGPSHTRGQWCPIRLQIEVRLRVSLCRPKAVRGFLRLILKSLLAQLALVSAELIILLLLKLL